MEQPLPVERRQPGRDVDPERVRVGAGRERTLAIELHLEWAHEEVTPHDAAVLPRAIDGVRLRAEEQLNVIRTRDRLRHVHLQRSFGARAQHDAPKGQEHLEFRLRQERHPAILRQVGGPHAGVERLPVSRRRVRIGPSDDGVTAAAG